MPVCDNGFLAAGAGDGCGAGEGFQPAGVRKAGAVFADLGQHLGTGELSQAGAGDDLGVRVLTIVGDRRLGEFVGCRAGRIELASSAPSWIEGRVQVKQCYIHCRFHGQNSLSMRNCRRLPPSVGLPSHG